VSRPAAINNLTAENTACASWPSGEFPEHDPRRTSGDFRKPARSVKHYVVAIRDWDHRHSFALTGFHVTCGMRFVPA